MSNIYKISNDIQLILETIENEETPVSDDVIADTIEGLEGELEYKVNDWCRAIRNIKYEIDNITAEGRRLNDIKKAKEKEVERMKAVLHNILTKLGYEKYRTSEYSLYGFKTDKLDIAPIKYIPDEFKKERINYEPDKEKIKSALAEGKELSFAKFTSSLTVSDRYRAKREE